MGSIKRQGLATLNSFGFSFGQPGQAIDSDAFASFFEGLVGPGQTLKTMAAAKNLLFESHVFNTASLKNRVENTTESIKPVPLAERSARLDKLRAKYTGFNITKALEPGHSLLDATSHQAESKTLRYIPPSRCASREQEIVANKDRLAKTLEVEGGALKIRDAPDKPLFVDNPTEFLVYQALRRRGLAYDFADLVSYEVHQEWVDWLFQEMSKEPVKGFQRTQLAQILRADKAAWLHLADTFAPRLERGR